MEKRDLYDEKRNLIGKTIFKGEEPPEGTFIVVVLVFIQNKDGKFLMQKRSVQKEGKYATTGGHPKHGESSIEGIITEVKEEIGYDMNKDDLVLYETGVVPEKRVFYDDYYLKVDDIDISKLVLQKEEVESLRWMTEEEVRNEMAKGNFFKNHFEEFEILIDWLKMRG